MIEHFNTSITYPTMFGADRFNGSTGMADSLQRVLTLLPLIIMSYLNTYKIKIFTDIIN